MVWVVVLLLIVFILWKTREGFDIPTVISGVKEPSITDKKLVSTIETVMPPGSKLDTYIAILKDYYSTVFSSTKTTPSVQEIQAYLFQQSISAQDIEALTKIMPEIFTTTVYNDEKTSDFVPDGSLIQPEMAAEPVKDNAKRGVYETSDKDPVMPNSKVMAQRSSLQRGDGPNVAAYSWNLAAYQQDNVQSAPGGKTNPYVPKLPGTTEHMSTMAGAVTQTNEIYGPRIPKQELSPPVDPVSSVDSTKMLPNLYAPIGVRPLRNRSSGGSGGSGGLGGSGGSGGFDDVSGAVSGPGFVPGESVGPGDLSILATSADYVPIERVPIPDTTKTEPVPFLADFSKFFR
jgi:hypothetical protein